MQTSLNLPGFSFTLLLLPRKGEEYEPEKILEYLDASASAPGWRFSSGSKPGEPDVKVGTNKGGADEDEALLVKSGAAPVKLADFAAFEKAITAAAHNVIKAEPEITRFDTIAGDGDCGLTLKAGAEGVLKQFKEGKVDQNDLVTSVLSIASSVEKTMDGTSGALYSIWLNGVAAGLVAAAKEKGTHEASRPVIALALQKALATLFTYTPARAPSRTLVDPLQAFTDAFGQSEGADFDGAVRAAFEAAEKTKDLVAKAGRAAYVGREELQKAQVPDPGAWGVVKLLEGIQSTL